MAQTTTYTCDRCGKWEVDKSDFLVPVAVRVGSSWAKDGWTNAIIPTQMWCKECIAAMGILHPGTMGMNAPLLSVAPTLEEVIREIVRDEVEGLTGAC